MLDLLDNVREHRHLYPEDLSGSSTKHVEALQTALVDMDLSLLEKRWYLSVLRRRLQMLSALNALGISHGDIKADCFGLPDSPHDIVLYDLSRSYTFTPDRPCVMNGTRHLRSMRTAAEKDRRIIQALVLDM